MKRLNLFNVHSSTELYYANFLLILIEKLEFVDASST